MSHYGTQQERIRRRCVDLIYAQTKTAVMASLLGGFLVCAVFWDTANLHLLSATAVIYAGMILLRYHHQREYRKASVETDTAPWVLRLTITQGINGLAWGLLCAYLSTIADPYQLLLIITIVAAMQSGAVLAYSFILRIYASFALALSLPITVLLALQPTAALQAVAAIVAVWTAFLVVCAKRFGRFYRRSVRYSFVNMDLARNLETKHSQVMDLNASLREKIVALRETQAELLEEKKQVGLLVAQLQQHSITDALTGLRNRRYFDEALARAWSAAIRSGGAISLILADVDHFKGYNDCYGHPMGDECLGLVADALDAMAQRPNDCVARYGGEEFAIILPNSVEADALALAEAARERIQAMGIAHERSPCFRHVTMSFGVATLRPCPHQHLQGLINGADQALYEAKAGGRNQVRCYQGEGLHAIAQAQELGRVIGTETG